MKTREDFETAEEYVAYLESENARLKTKAIAGRDLTMKISEKGGLSVYGLGRFPVTLYEEQWLRLISHSEDIVSFLKANQGKFSTKADKKAA